MRTDPDLLLSKLARFLVLTSNAFHQGFMQLPYCGKADTPVSNISPCLHQCIATIHYLVDILRFFGFIYLAGLKFQDFIQGGLRSFDPR